MLALAPSLVMVMVVAVEPLVRAAAPLSAPVTAAKMPMSIEDYPLTGRPLCVCGGSTLSMAASCLVSISSSASAPVPGLGAVDEPPEGDSTLVLT